MELLRIPLKTDTNMIIIIFIISDYWTNSECNEQMKNINDTFE